MDYTDQRFKEGEEIKCIFWPDGEKCKVGSNGVERITVVMEYGQMAEVPWFAVWKDGKVKAKYNGAMLEGIEV